MFFLALNWILQATLADLFSALKDYAEDVVSAVMNHNVRGLLMGEDFTRPRTGVCVGHHCGSMRYPRAGPRPNVISRKESLLRPFH